MPFTPEELEGLEKSTPEEKTEILRLISVEQRTALADKNQARSRELQEMADIVARKALRQVSPEEPKFIPSISSAEPTRHLLGRA